MYNIDLHIHTNCSDGALSPKEIIEEAIKNNVRVISITDHDSIDAYSEDLINYASTHGIQLITGVEISTQINKVGFHVLGYNFDINNLDLRNKLSSLKKSRYDYLYRVCEKLSELGYSVNIDELNCIEIVTKAHIARSVINNEENKDVLLNNFHQLPNIGKFIETIMNEGCPAYVEKNSITPVEASNLIKKAKGKVVLAHPVAYEYEDNLNEVDILNLVNEMDADGIEAIYVYVDRNNHKINEIENWKQLAIDNHLFYTIGSDFHCFDQIHPTIGLMNESVHVSDEEIENIIQVLTY